MDQHPHHVAGLDALLARELVGDLDERLGLQLDEPLDVLGDVVLVLGEPVARGDVGELVDGPEPVRPARRLVVEERRG